MDFDLSKEHRKLNSDVRNQKLMDKMELRRNKFENSKFSKVPIASTIIRSVTFEFPKSGMDAIGIDLIQATISIIPIYGDLVIGIPRTARFSIDEDIPDFSRKKVVSLSVADFILGAIPVMGDVIDFMVFSNTVSYGIVQKDKGDKFHWFRNGNGN